VLLREILARLRAAAEKVGLRAQREPVGDGRAREAFGGPAFAGGFENINVVCVEYQEGIV